jgi:uroporphyrinogen-III synthase
MATILVIRADDSFSQLLRESGHDVENLELIKTRPVEDLSEIRDRLARSAEYDGIFFTSPIAAEIFTRERNDSNRFHGRVYALGQRARDVLETAGIKVSWSAGSNTAEEMLAAIGNDEFAGKRFLFIRGERSLRTIPDLLRDVATIEEVVVYITEMLRIDQDRIDSIYSRLTYGEIDYVCFFSPSGIGRFAELFNEASTIPKVAAIGTTTAQAASQAGYNVELVSPKATADEFAKALIEHINDIG